MISEEKVLDQLAGVTTYQLRLWVEQEWIIPAHGDDRPLFNEADLARMRLLQTLENDLAVGIEAIPVILSLVDQLHELRGFVKALDNALEAQPNELRNELRRVFDEELPPD